MSSGDIEQAQQTAELAIHELSELGEAHAIGAV
jgi:hypothetical protein